MNTPRLDYRKQLPCSNNILWYRKMCHLRKVPQGRHNDGEATVTDHSIRHCWQTCPYQNNRDAIRSDQTPFGQSNVHRRSLDGKLENVRERVELDIGRIENKLDALEKRVLHVWQAQSRKQTDTILTLSVVALINSGLPEPYASEHARLWLHWPRHPFMGHQLPYMVKQRSTSQITTL